MFTLNTVADILFVFLVLNVWAKYIFDFIMVETLWTDK